MAKDPAFLFYSEKFLVGTMTMPFEDRGKYITLLCYMHQNGRISEETIRLLVGSVSVMLMDKFVKDENGLFYNERLETEAEKRAKFTESRQNNGSKGGRPVKNQSVTKNNLSVIGRLEKTKPKQNLPININIISNTIEYLNNKSGKNFKNDSAETVKVLTAKINAGYGEVDFKKVIDIKTAKWKNDPAMEQYLRPSTLFGSKFESYLNETPVVKLQSGFKR